MLAEPTSPDLEPPEFLAAVGDIFSCFDRQDSGNVSFGVAVGRDRCSYRLGPYPNTMGRMIGSTRFMAPEEFQKGRTIDERTTVFAMGRTIGIFLGDIPALEQVTDVACADDPCARYATVAKLAVAFREAAAAP